MNRKPGLSPKLLLALAAVLGFLWLVIWLSPQNVPASERPGTGLLHPEGGK